MRGFIDSAAVEYRSSGGSGGGPVTTCVCRLKARKCGATVVRDSAVRCQPGISWLPVSRRAASLTAGPSLYSSSSSQRKSLPASRVAPANPSSLLLGQGFNFLSP